MQASTLVKLISLSGILTVSVARSQHIHAHEAADRDTNRAVTSVAADSSCPGHKTAYRGSEGQSHDYGSSSSVQDHHVMVMAGVGALGDVPNFTSVGIGYEYRLPLWDRRIGIGLMGMGMFSQVRSHLMVVGTGTFHPDEHCFVQGEIGGAHKQASSGGGGADRHQMALLLGLGIGRHFHLGGIALAPMINGEYSRLQKPTYSLVLCLGW